MLGKLIKHEFKATARIIWPMYAGMVVLALITRLAAMPLLDSQHSFFINAISILIIFLFGLCMIALAFMPLIISAVRFKKNILGSEGYLTMSLPVNTDQVLCSKMITSLVWYFASALLGLAIILMMVFWGQDIQLFSGGIDLKGFFEEAARLSAENKKIIWNVVLLITEFVVDGVILINLGTLIVYASYSIGYSVNKHKSLLTVVLFFVLFHISNWVCVLGIFIFGRQSQRWIDFMTGVNGLQSFLAGMLLLMLISSAVLYFITRFFITRKLNLE